MTTRILAVSIVLAVSGQILAWASALAIAAPAAAEVTLLAALG